MLALGTNLIPVGQYIERFNQISGQNLPLGTIFQSNGLAKHIQKRHPNDIGNLTYLSAIISAPDYVGHNPKEPNSIELVKTISDNIMVCVKLDSNLGYLYVSSVFPISSGKMQNRINSGRLKKF